MLSATRCLHSAATSSLRTTISTRKPETRPTTRIPVENKSKDGDQTIGAGFYGLAPLRTDGVSVIPQALKDAGIDAALATYEANEPHPATALPPVQGMIVVLFGWESTQRMATLHKYGYQFRPK